MAFADRIFDFLSSGARRAYDEVEEEIYHAIQHRVRMVERKVKREAMSMFLLLSGSIFLLLSIVYFMVEYLALSKAVSFLIPAVLLLFIGLFMRMGS